MQITTLKLKDFFFNQCNMYKLVAIKVLFYLLGFSITVISIHI